MGLQISIVIPNLDSPHVAATVDSLRSQTISGDRYEIVVVGSDRPGQIRRDPLVRFIETEGPLGPGEARNRGVSEARCDLLLFTDADCRPQADWLHRHLTALSEYPVVGGAVRFSLSGNRWSVGDNIASFHELLTDRDAAVNSGPIGTLNLGFRREAWDLVGPFDPQLITSEDYDWYLRARARGVDVRFEPDAVVEHADVRSSKEDLQGHASWYGRHFREFCSKHPGIFAQGPTWRSKRALALTAPLKSWLSALLIFARHPILRPAWRALPAVVAFKSAWYKAVLASWSDR